MTSYQNLTNIKMPWLETLLLALSLASSGITADSIPKHPHISRGPHSAGTWDAIRDKLEFAADDIEVEIRNTDGDLSFIPVPSGNDEVSITWQWKQDETEAPEVHQWCLWPPIWYSTLQSPDPESLFRVLKVEELNSVSEDLWRRLIQSRAIIKLSDELQRGKTIYFSKMQNFSSPLLKKVEIEFFKSACSDLVQRWVNLGRSETAQKTMEDRQTFSREELLAGKEMLDILVEIVSTPEINSDTAIRVDCASLYYNWLCFSFIGDLKKIPDTPISSLSEDASFNNGIDLVDFRDGINKLGGILESADYLQILDLASGPNIRGYIQAKQLDQASLATLGAAITYANRQIRSPRKVVSQRRDLFRLAEH